MNEGVVVWEVDLLLDRDREGSSWVACVLDHQLFQLYRCRKKYRECNIVQCVPKMASRGSRADGRAR
jgi:hypothetical protein